MNNVDGVQYNILKWEMSYEYFKWLFFKFFRICKLNGI